MANRVELLDSILKAVATLNVTAPASGLAGTEARLEELLSEADNVLWDAVDYISDTHRFANGEVGVII